MEDCTLEEQLLLHAKEGNCPQVQRLLQSRIHQNSSLNINCRSRSKTCSGWTPLHLACSFGHRDVVEELLKAGADVNLQNNLGDTPLHKAAYAGRKEIVLLLLRYDACANIINGTAQIPKDVTEDDEIITMLEAAERRAARRHEEKLLEAAREGAISTLSKLLNGKDAPDIHCRDSVGNTPLHCAAYRGQKQCVIKLLKCGANPSIKNNNVLLRGVFVKLFRFYKCISDFLLFQVKPWDHCFFMLRCFDDSVHYFKVPSQTNRWLDAFEEHASYCTRHDTEESSSVKFLSCLKLLQAARAFQQKLESEVSTFLSMAKNEENYGKKSSLCLPFFLLFILLSHRTSLPAPMFSRNDVSIWSILKKCIGMELSKIAMPVVFNEPLSFLQRLTEYMEHTYLIHQANATTDSIERMKCVAAFAVSAVASQWERTGKPFNPLLGETYELIRDDLGFRWMSEQVSHHPPVSAFHAEGLKEDFVFHGSIYPKLKFWGKSIEAEPKGVITLELPKYNEAYTWTNPTCCVHNIIVGQLWIEQYGSVEVLNHKTGERCSMTFKPCGLFGKELHKVEGYILDKSKKKLCAIYGKWTECLYTVDPATFDAHKKTEKKNPDEKKGNKQTSVDEEPEEMPPPDTETVQVIPGSELIWKITPRPENSSKFYAFSTFAMQLNELDKRMEGVIPSTDSRLRPDICAMEKGDIDLASAEKKRLEEKQRMARKNRTKSTEEWKVRWFQQGPNPHNKAQDWLYLKGYWDRNYSQLPDIY
uniref:Oxysterol-binding protein n=1 Tax=Astatotilapia calliptera TaxID=8154 RepID=A0AAX7VSD0_ASTCA